MGSLLDLSSPATVVGQPQVVHTYDNTNRLTTIAQNTSTVTTAYDYADRRTSVTYPNTNKVEYVYNAASELTTVTHKQGTTTNFLYDGLNPVQEKDGATVTANLLTGLGIGKFFTRTDGVGVRVLLPDALANIGTYTVAVFVPEPIRTHQKQ